jgi:hypothetical protein
MSIVLQGFIFSSRHAAYKVTSVDEVLKLMFNNSAETTANTQSKE